MLHFLFVSSVARTDELAATVTVLDISDITQFFCHNKSSFISQLNKGRSNDLQKLLKYFNVTTISVSIFFL